MPLSTKLFHQYTNGGDYISNDGWRIVPDPLVEDGDNFRRIWRLISPVGKQVAEGFSPQVQTASFDVIATSFYKLQAASKGDRLSIDEVVTTQTLH